VLTNRKVSDVLCRRLIETPYKLDQTAFSEVAEITPGRALVRCVLSFFSEKGCQHGGPPLG
jgi:hypothetical protein